MNCQPSDIEWTRNFLENLNHNGIWGIPRAESVWRVDKTNRVLTLIHGDPAHSDNKTLNYICPLIGYRAEHKPEAMTPEEVKEVMDRTPQVVGADMAGTGKSLTRIAEKKLKTYLHQKLDEATLRKLKVNLAKLPASRRFKGKTNVQCDFCANDNPVFQYAASRMADGRPIQCWRWCACRGCHEAITQNDWKELERRCKAGLGMGDLFAVKASLMAFHTDAVET